MLRTVTREFYIPRGATKIASKQSDAVAYLYGRDGRLFALGFAGKAIKPSWNYRFRSPAERENHVRGFFERCAARAGDKAKRQAEQRDATHGLQLGHVLVASWGYDQTNVNFYQVTRLVSSKMVELHPIGSMDGKAMSSMSGTVLPVIDAFTGEPMRKRARDGGVRIDSSRYARVWDGKPVYSSSYH